MPLMRRIAQPPTRISSSTTPRQIAFTTLRSPLIRAAIALLFAVPAAVAGYHAALRLAHIAIPAEVWQNALAVAGAIIVAATGWARWRSLPPPGAVQRIASALRSPDPLRPQAH
jgi:hypothetical protein